MEIMVENQLEYGYLNVPEHISSKKDLILYLQNVNKDIAELCDALQSDWNYEVSLVITPSKEHPEGVIKELK